MSTFVGLACFGRRRAKAESGRRSASKEAKARHMFGKVPVPFGITLASGV